MMRIYDLTRTVKSGMPVYPGDPLVRFQPHAALGTDGYQVTEITLGTHAGTHVDAPAHFLADGATVDCLPLEKLVGTAWVVDHDVTEFRVDAGARVLIRSGWSARWNEADYFTGFPALSPAMIEELARAPAALIGLETPSLHPEPEEDARYHRLLLEAGVVIVENLTGLEHLPRHVFLAALPLPLADADGAPCRVVAFELVPTAESERP